MKVAIVITTYNNEKTIQPVLESVLCQGDSLKELYEVFIADDGSKDQTLKIIKDVWTAPVPLEIIRQEKNIGEWKNVNFVLSRLHGQTDWILNLHSDNPVKSHWLRTMLFYIKQCPVNVATISSSWDYILPNGKVIPGEDDPQRKPVIISGGPEAVRSTLIRGCWWHNCGCAIRIEAYETIGEFDSSLKQKGDWDWLLRLLEKGWAVMYVPRCLFDYTVIEHSLSSVNLFKNIDIKESATIFQKYLRIVLFSDILLFHAQLFFLLIRRFLRGFITLHVKKMGYAFATLLFILKGFFYSLCMKVWLKITS